MWLMSPKIEISRGFVQSQKEYPLEINDIIDFIFYLKKGTTTD